MAVGTCWQALFSFLKSLHLRHDLVSGGVGVGVLSHFSCVKYVTLCDPMDRSLPGFSVQSRTMKTSTLTKGLPGHPCSDLTEIWLLELLSQYTSRTISVAYIQETIFPQKNIIHWHLRKRYSSSWFSHILKFMCNLGHKIYKVSMILYQIRLYQQTCWSH